MREEREMNKEAFIRRLRELLAGLPQNEAAEAIQYYEDYFADAGAENEAKVIEELGSPEKVAANIRADLGMEGTGSDYEGNTPSGGVYSSGSRSGSDGNYHDSDAGSTQSNGSYGRERESGGRDRYDRYHGDSDSSRYHGYADPPKEKHTALWIVLAICTCYLWIPLLFVVLVLVFVAIIVACALSFAFGVTAFAFGVAAIAMIGVAIVRMFISPAGGLVLLGAGLVIAGLTIFCMYLVLRLFGSAIPALFRWIGSLGKKAQRRRGDAR